MSTKNELVISLVEAIEIANRKYRTAYARELSRLQLTGAEADALAVVGKFPVRKPPFLSQIAEALSADVLPSRTIKQLRKKRRLTRIEEKDPKDERKRRFRLTAKGKKTVSEIRKIRKGLLAQLSKSASKRDLVAAIKVCRQIDC
jgi:DNA-binding MarR family transcriptional regulator